MLVDRADNQRVHGCLDAGEVAGRDGTLGDQHRLALGAAERVEGDHRSAAIDRHFKQAARGVLWLPGNTDGLILWAWRYKIWLWLEILFGCFLTTIAVAGLTELVKKD